MQSEQSDYERYKREIYRIGWRVQYRAKKLRKSECPIYEFNTMGVSFTEESDLKITLQQLMEELSEKDREILLSIYVKGYTETELAKIYNMSQQAVNKWKRKTIKRISQTPISMH
ncbi:sigma factor-like helix-turn-helix DNA-binding protein [Paenibacillus sp. 11B]|uniref:sigma factor-like helix-turn-helix DNA-binding protein n=1 Tax=unclassified Paenibacillus TaxID=185978 RepID=UPI000CF89F0E|nr:MULTISPECIES: sigma factor-like helix-turn-helix DNA-binding protein [unclassified Paenibacillus]MDN8593193.1 sigma factor-like helix-turn-helix DNA-binding protein [Paenibacillus sp. 11B]PQP80312.1 hypothetical protein C0Q44_28270 [Paenibacillus sp. PCH8]